MPVLDAAITTRLEKSDKRDVTAIVEGLGFDVPSVTRAFYKQIIRTGRVPLDLTVGAYNTADPAYLESEEFFSSGAQGSYLRPADLVSDILAGA